MSKEATITVRLEGGLKRRIERRAKRERRSLSAQVEYELERALQDEAPGAAPIVSESFVGRYAGAKVPTDEDFAEVRALLWGRLGRST